MQLPVGFLVQLLRKFFLTPDFLGKTTIRRQRELNREGDMGKSSQETTFPFQIRLHYRIFSAIESHEADMYE